MRSKDNCGSLPRGDAYEHEKAIAVLSKMKTLEDEMAPRMTTIVCHNGTIISGTNEEWLYECKKKVDNVIKTERF